MTPFEYALDVLWPEEGLLSDNPKDKGGRTMLGVTQNVFDRWRDSQGMKRADVATITREEATNLYHDLFWVPAHCPDLPKRLACMLFDTAVNSGPSEALVLLQRAVGVPVDGRWGSATATAVQFFDSSAEDLAIHEYCAARLHFMEQLAVKDPEHYAWALAGWQHRVDALTAKLIQAEAE